VSLVSAFSTLYGLVADVLLLNGLWRLATTRTLLVRYLDVEDIFHTSVDALQFSATLLASFYTVFEVMSLAILFRNLIRGYGIIKSNRIASCYLNVWAYAFQRNRSFDNYAVFSEIEKALVCTDRWALNCFAWFRDWPSTLLVDGPQLLILILHSVTFLNGSIQGTLNTVMLIVKFTLLGPTNAIFLMFVFTYPLLHCQIARQTKSLRTSLQEFIMLKVNKRINSIMSEEKETSIN